ncbi:helix-turn-helix domain-containing protein [Natronorubrum aibiense]|uniref:Bacterio-opsin activator n=1 Tax=Natronorubrum aibiense TaxID=348826 RepID=A0A5P9P5J1_9EURY|nr:helix-turn-helix domain-containing protein [Natronorubrum aibiense]QFU83403.1 bacterio-opsin activator [Natronorubrum aibiense]QFU84280.1 bacterio-opsin activator [Natronorubrum aibiense]
MSVVAEFTVDADQFQLGNTLSGVPGITFELERCVPTGDLALPFLWATTEEDLDEVVETFETQLLDSQYVKKILALDKIKNGIFYRISWTDPTEDLLDAIITSDATILQARSEQGTRWEFSVRFVDHDKLALFQNTLADHEVRIHIDRIYTFAEETDHRRQFDLSFEQREALVLAVQRGYFATPSKVSLDELADELGITKQAVSARIRRANEKVLETTLLSSAVAERGGD